MPTHPHLGFNTLAIHDLDGQEPLHDALNPPVFLTSSFSFSSTEEAAETFAGEHQRFVYGRVHNPTQAALESRLARLEGAEDCVAFASGMGAINSLFWSFLQAGDLVVAHCRMYGNSYSFLTEGLKRFGVAVELIDLLDSYALCHALERQPKIVFFESPSNPLLEVIDIAAVARQAHDAGALCVVDSTLASPVIQRPLDLGADFVLHSMTKYLGGHGDLLAGAIAGRADDIARIRMCGLRYMTGATISPVSAYLVLRGVATLGIRMQRHTENASAVARFLSEHPKVAQVLYPGLDSHPQAALARRQMKMPGGLLSVELTGGPAAATRFMNALRLATRAVSLGDTKTLVQHPASMTHAGYGVDELRRYGLSEALVRMSIGLEDIEDIEADLAQSLGFV